MHPHGTGAANDIAAGITNITQPALHDYWGYELHRTRTIGGKRGDHARAPQRAGSSNAGTRCVSNAGPSTYQYRGTRSKRTQIAGHVDFPCRVPATSVACASG